MRPYEAPDLSPGRDTSTLKLDTKLYSPSTALDRPSIHTHLNCWLVHVVVQLYHWRVIGEGPP